MSYISGHILKKNSSNFHNWIKKMGTVIIIILSKREKKKGTCQKLIIDLFFVLQILQLAKCKLSKILAF